MTDTSAPQSETAPTIRRACQNCDFWEVSGLTGQCRRSAPVSQVQQPELVIWPVTHGKHWCGEYLAKDIQIATETQALGMLRTLGGHLDTAAEALLQAAEAFRAKGMGQQASQAHLAYRAAKAQAEPYRA